LLYDPVAMCAGVQAGETRACEDLYAFIRDVSWYRLCKSIWFGYGVEDPEDCMQDIYISLLEAIRNGRVREPARLAGFVQKVTKYKIANVVDAQIWNRLNLHAVEIDGVTAFDKSDPEYEARYYEHDRIASEALLDLLPSQREILTRYYLQGQKEPQICREMKLTATQFRLRKSRAKERFGELGKRRLEGKRERISRQVKTAA
jgi:RNA polymerase sigma-70 factor (ECF subfamily)